MEWSDRKTHTSPFPELRKCLLGRSSVGFPQLLQLLEFIHVWILVTTPQGTSGEFEDAQGRCQGRTVAQQRREGPGYTTCQSSTTYLTVACYQEFIKNEPRRPRSEPEKKPPNATFQ